VQEASRIELVSIPKGSFYMGSKPGDKDAFPEEKPQHKVTISKPFFLGKYHVTVGQFRRFVDATGYKTEAEKAGDSRTWRKSGIVQTDEHPVVCVSWNDADAFCRWLVKESGATVRLPCEAEWEYACQPGRRRSSTSATTRRTSATMPGTTRIQAIAHTLAASRSPMTLASMTCTG
jgi:formylglycine-generating enzyme required for sulfatase activity